MTTRTAATTTNMVYYEISWIWKSNIAAVKHFSQRVSISGTTDRSSKKMATQIIYLMKLWNLLIITEAAAAAVAAARSPEGQIVKTPVSWSY